MTRGNQREIDRARAQARSAKSAGGDKREGSKLQKNAQDGGALEAKRAKKEEEARKQKEVAEATAAYNAQVAAAAAAAKKK